MCFKTKPGILSLLGFFASQAGANQVVSETKATDISTLSNWPVVLIVLLGMIGLIFALAWFVKRFGGLNFSGNRDIKIVSAVPVGTRERIALIDVKGQQFLIGVTAQQITPLHAFDEAVVPMATSQPAIRQSDFFNKLQGVMNPQKKARPAESTDSLKASGTEPSSDNNQTTKRDENAL